MVDRRAGNSTWAGGRRFQAPHLRRANNDRAARGAIPVLGAGVAPSPGKADRVAPFLRQVYDIHSEIHTDSPLNLTPGRVYRTAELRRWVSNPTRTAERLVASGELRKLRHGLYYRPQRSKWGVVPPARDEVLRALLKDTPFVVTGSGVWNALGLGSTAVFAIPLVYNSKLSCDTTIAAFRFAFRRVRFPRRLFAEWFVVDLIQNRRMAGLDAETLVPALCSALKEGRFNAALLTRTAVEYGTRDTQATVAEAIRDAAQQSSKADV